MFTPDEETPRDLWVVYHDQCPFCASYVLLYRMRRHTAQVHLIDARSPHPIVDELRRGNIDLDDGMAVKSAGRFYHGAEALQILAILGSGETIFNGLNRALFRHPGLSRRLYPLLVRGRLMTLRLFGRPLLNKP